MRFQQPETYFSLFLAGASTSPRDFSDHERTKTSLDKQACHGPPREQNVKCMVGSEKLSEKFELHEKWRRMGRLRRHSGLASIALAFFAALSAPRVRTLATSPGLAISWRWSTCVFTSGELGASRQCKASRVCKAASIFQRFAALQQTGSHHTSSARGVSKVAKWASRTSACQAVAYRSRRGSLDGSPAPRAAPTSFFG